ncbi:hypothetical protein QVD17_18663 [Tagetes erecta]|uniref:Uncharacterized protein n=1 Tax=Tagetes erecta TaxID=13708 RepID=A0AAD8NVY1_TARER|nr:hypothetical protein QVD17_18663 [Tagetes erecta]
MSSSSSQLYNRLLNDDDDTSSDEYEEEMAVTSAMSFVVRGLFEEMENTTNPIRKRVTGLQKCTSALRVLAYGNTTDINDEYLKMSEKTTRDTLEHFTKGIIKIYGQRYLRKPTWNDLQRIYEVHQEVHGLPVEEEITQATFEERVANDAYLRNKYEHYALMADFIEHAWSVRTIPDNDDDAS